MIISYFEIQAAVQRDLLKIEKVVIAGKGKGSQCCHPIRRKNNRFRDRDEKIFFMAISNTFFYFCHLFQVSKYEYNN